MVGDGDAVRRLGLESIFKRFAPVGVDALKSNGDDALVRLLFDADAVAVVNVWLIDGADAKNG